MKNLADYQHLLNRKQINVPEYGTFYPCHDLNTECRTCMADWNYKWELPHIKYIRSYLDFGSVGIDIGAHIGIYGISLNPKVKTMYSFEPEQSAFEALLMNSVQFPNIIPFQLFVSGSPETEHSVSLDNFFGDYFQVDFIKIDVEGEEIEILEGAKNIIRNNHNLIILAEFEMPHLMKKGILPFEFFNRLQNIGLDCTDFYDQHKAHFYDAYFTNLIITKDGQAVRCQILGDNIK